MTFGKYVKDRAVCLIIDIIVIAVITGMLVIFDLNRVALGLIILLLVIAVIVNLFYDYSRKKDFYDTLIPNVERLDKAYLVLETLERPGFYEGGLIYDTLYDINKSMTENVTLFQTENREFSEYIEMWIHEVKLPLSAISLKLHNMMKEDGGPNLKRLLHETRRIEDYINQVLYLVRSQNASKDYHITDVPLSAVIHDTAMANRENLLDSGMEFVIEPEVYDEETGKTASINDVNVKTDQKWLVFILGQLIANSIKYRKNNEETPYVKLSAGSSKRGVVITVEDNGIGIPEKDIKRVFEKTFTGSNGKDKTKSTGMGLYIVKQLCDKLGHKVTIESSLNEWTRVKLEIDKESLFDVL